MVNVSPSINRFIRFVVDASLMLPSPKRHGLCTPSDHLILEPPLLHQPLQLLHRVLQRHKLAHLLSRRIVAVADIDGTRITFLRAEDEDEVVQRQLTGADLLLHLQQQLLDLQDSEREG